MQKRIDKLHIENIDIILGNFNITEDLCDQAPAHYDDYTAVKALQKFWESHNACDAWQHNHPNARTFTFTSKVYSTSCLDRIYV